MTYPRGCREFSGFQEHECPQLGRSLSSIPYCTVKTSSNNVNPNWGRGALFKRTTVVYVSLTFLASSGDAVYTFGDINKDA